MTTRTITATTQYGPGDEQTWGPVIDARDPRAGSREVTIGAISYLIDAATGRIGRAERMLAAGDIDAAIDTLRDIGRDLVDADWSEA